MKNYILLLALVVNLPVANATPTAAKLCADHVAREKSKIKLAEGVRRPTDVYIIEKTGAVEEHSIRVDQTAAHLYLDSANKQSPYFFAAFPEGNSGVSIWFKSAGGKTHLQTTTKPKTITGANGLHGIKTTIKSGAQRLEIEDSVLGSMRFIRDRELNVAIPNEVHSNDVQLIDGVLTLKRKSLNGLFEYVLKIQPEIGTHIERVGQGYALVSKTEARFKIEAMTSEKALTPMPPEEIFTSDALKRISPEKLKAFSFLFFREKMMAGSPRYLSKFGRDSIYTLRVLMKDMRPEAIESLLNATMSSMHPEKGLVSHEQHEGDFASFVRLREGKDIRGKTEAIEDYEMIDAEYAFTVTLANYQKMYPDRFQKFLDGHEHRGISRRDLTTQLFQHVRNSTKAFAKEPIYKNLVGLHKGRTTGQWRDSDAGLGFGKYPFDVNAALVPGALKSLSEIYADPNSGFFQPALAATLRQSFEVWNSKAAPLFLVRFSGQEAQVAAEAYYRSLELDPLTLPSTPREDIEFYAIAINENGSQVKIMHSDDSLLMTFGEPSFEVLNRVSQRIHHEFPYGLRMRVKNSDGSQSEKILVANPVFENPELQMKFDETKYHGRVSWMMQEDLLHYGLLRQIERRDLPDRLRASLTIASTVMKRVIDTRPSTGATEVYSIKFQNGVWVAVPFAGDAKANSNQLWSHLLMTQE